MRKEELPVLAASVDIGLLADRTLFLFEVKEDARFEDSDRHLLRDSAKSLKRLFLDTPEELVLSGNASYLASAQSGWYRTLAEAAPRARSAPESALRDWVQAAVETAEAMAEGEKVKRADRERFVALLDALSSATFAYAERVQGEPRFGGTEWSQRLTTVG
ncbi:MAG: hypothetical protein U1E22_02255 [Coriobacteriia bacterium]|nr:hypothetical protein [Coriobacteriia bacterium]